MTLGLYMVRRLAVAFGLIGAVFFAMLLLFETVEMIRRFGGQGTPMAEIVVLALLRVPATFYQILPLITILAAMTMTLALARSSELVVIRGAGRSAMRMLREPVLAAMAFGLLAVALLNPLTAIASRLYQDRLDTLTATENRPQISLEGDAIWMRQGDRRGQTVIRADRVDAETLVFERVSFQLFEQESGLPLLRIEAQSAQLAEGQWRLTDARRWDLNDENPERSAISFARLDLPSDLTGAQIRDRFARVGTLSVWALPEFIRALDRAGLSSRAHRAHYMSELALPVLLAAMTLVGSVLCFQHTRSGGTGIRVLLTVLAGFALFFVRNFAQVLGENGQIPLLLAVWTPPVASMLLAVGVLLHLEDG